MNFCKLFLSGTLLLLFALTANAQTVAVKPQLKPATEKRYRLNPGDVLEIVYRYTPEFNQTVAIQPDGFVVLEIVGETRTRRIDRRTGATKYFGKCRQTLERPGSNFAFKGISKAVFRRRRRSSAAGKISAKRKYHRSASRDARGRF